MRKRSGALHSSNQEDYLKLAEEQQQQQHFKEKHLRRAARGLNLACYNSQYDKALRGSQYGLIPFIEFERRGSSSSEREASREFEENKIIDNKLVDVMLLCEFGSSFLPEISLLDSFETSQGWCAGKNKDKMLDLIIAREKQQTNSDKDSQIIFKIWIHNSLSCQKSSFHTQIIEQIHYSRCQFFIFLFEENNMHDILECYERVKQIKGNMFKGAFVAIKTDIAFETNNLIPESLMAFKNLKSNHDNLSRLVSFREIDSKDVSEQLRLILKDAYAAQEGKENLTSNQDYLLENEKTPVSASTNKTRSSSSNSGNSSNSSNTSEGIEVSTNIKDIFQQNTLTEMQIDGQQNSQILGSSQQNINQKSNEEQQHQQQQNNQNNKTNNKLHPCKLKGSKSEDFVKLAEPFGGLEQQGVLNSGGKQQTRSFSYHCSSLCLKNNKKKDINHDFKSNIGDCFNIQKQNLFSQSHQIPREVTFNSSQH